MKTVISNGLIGCLLLLLIFSCKKQSISKMKKGKYEMTLTRTLQNGTQETYHCLGYGPGKSYNYYQFQSEIDNNGLWSISVYFEKEKTGKKTHESKTYSHIEAHFGTSMVYSTGYSNIDSYEISNKKLIIHYTSPMDASTGVIELKWIK